MSDKISVAEALRITGWSETTLNNYIYRGKITGRLYRFVERGSLVKYLASRKPGCRTGPRTFQQWLETNPYAKVIVAGVRARDSLRVIAQRAGLKDQRNVQNYVRRWYKELGLASPTYSYRKIRVSVGRKRRRQEIAKLKNNSWQELAASQENFPPGLKAVLAACQKTGLVCQPMLNKRSAKNYLERSCDQRSIVDKNMARIAGWLCCVHFSAIARLLGHSRSRWWCFGFRVSSNQTVHFHILVTASGDIFTIPTTSVAGLAKDCRGSVQIFIPEHDRVWRVFGHSQEPVVPSKSPWLKYRGFPPEFFSSPAVQSITQRQ